MASNNYNTPDIDETMGEGHLVDTPDTGTLAILNQSEINQQIATAKRFPRSITNFMKEAVSLVTMNAQTAAECNYALPRDGKVISGPSARFAEIVAYSWGNCRAGARVVSEGEEFIVAQGVMYDLEKNVAITYEVQRRIVDRNGRKFKTDMIGVTANAACSIALRNAVLKGVPKALWHPAYKKALSTIAGKTETLSERRENALREFGAYRVTPDMVYRVLGINGQQDISLDHLVIITGMLTALKDGDSTPEDMFRTRADEKGEAVAGATASSTDRLKDRYVNGAMPQTLSRRRRKEASNQRRQRRRLGPRAIRAVRQWKKRRKSRSG